MTQFLRSQTQQWPKHQPFLRLFGFFPTHLDLPSFAIIIRFCLTILLFPTRALDSDVISHVGRNNDLLKKWRVSGDFYLQEVITTCWKKDVMYASLGVTQAQSIFLRRATPMQWFPRSTRADRGSRTVPDPNLRLHTAQQSLSNGQIIILSRLLSSHWPGRWDFACLTKLKCRWTSWSWKLIAYI